MSGRCVQRAGGRISWIQNPRTSEKLKFYSKSHNLPQAGIQWYESLRQLSTSARQVIYRGQVAGMYQGQAAGIYRVLDPTKSPRTLENLKTHNRKP